MPLPPPVTNAVLPFNMPVMTSPCSDAWVSQHTVRTMTTEAPTIPVSWGQLAEVAAVLAPVAETIAVERSTLTAVNTRLWEIEDAIREKEAAQDFGDTFV